MDCRPGTLLKKVWQRYLANMFVVELFLNQIAGTNSRAATLDLLKRNLHQGGFLVNILEFTALLQKGLRWAPFFDKVIGFAGSTLLKHWSAIDLFVKIFFLRKLAFDTYSEKDLWRSLFIEDLQSVNCKHVTLLKNTIIDVFLRNL